MPIDRRALPLVGVAFAAALLALAEAGLRLSGFGAREPFFVEGTDALGRAWVRANDKVGNNWFRTPEWEEQIKAPRVSLFAKEKPAGAYRVFVVGESSAYGTPWPHNGTWASMLEPMLEATTGRDVEVVNCGIRASSLDIQPPIVEQIRAYAPDLLVVYAGHNEYYGVRDPSPLEDLRLFRWLQARLTPKDDSGHLGLRASFTVDPDAAAHAEVVTRLREELDRVLDAAGPVPVVVAVPWANERDLAPVGSWVAPGHEAAAERAAALVARVEDQPDRAGEARDELVALEAELPKHAGVQHALGLAAERAGDPAQARERFRASIELDTVPIRARAATREAMQAVVAARTAGVAMTCDPEGAFRGASANGLFGHDLFTDHVHLSLTGGYLFAREVARCLAGDARFGLAPDLARAPSEAEVRERLDLTDLDELIAYTTMERYFQSATVQASPSRDRSIAGYRALIESIVSVLEPFERQAMGTRGPLGIHGEVARRLDRRLDPERYLAEWRRSVANNPGAGPPHLGYAMALAEAGDAAGARDQVALALLLGVPAQDAERAARVVGLR